MIQQMVIPIEGLPATALDAAAIFHRDYLPQILSALDEGAQIVAIIFPPAPYDHRDWRLAIIRDLARAHTPKRINGIVGNDATARSATLEYLLNAPAITGQLLELSA